MGPVLVIAGPTASGKTGLAEALAQKWPLRLLSADSQLVYRGLDIGTAKPPLPARAQWGLIDLVDPGQGFSAGDFCRAAVPLAQQAWREGKTPCFVGGTGLYLKALLDGLAEVPAVPADVREALEREFAAEGLTPLLARLDAGDPALAAHMDRKNPRRVLRALEVLEATGQPLSAWQRHTKPALAPTRALWLGLDPGKAELEARMVDRLEQTFRDGWLDEVQGLKEKWGLEAVGKCAAIGYPELLAHLESRLSLAEAKAEILAQTRRYARRQRTWFKAQAGIQWHASADEALADPPLARFFS